MVPHGPSNNLTAVVDILQDWKLLFGLVILLAGGFG